MFHVRYNHVNGLSDVRGAPMVACVFCMIASGEIPATKIYEDDTVIAFDDVAPVAPVHTLVIPRDHYTHVGDDVPDQVMAALLGKIPEIARLKGIDKSGYRVIINKGPDANQTVDHLHLHIIGGRAMSHGMCNFKE